MDELGRQIETLIDSSEPVTLDEAVSLRPYHEPRARSPRITMIAAAVVVVAVGFVAAISVLGDPEDSLPVATVGAPPTPDSYGVAGDCGIGVLEDTVRFEGSSSGSLCLGTNPALSTSTETVVDLITQGGIHPVRRLIVTDCVNRTSGEGHLLQHDGTTAWQVHGVVPAEVAYVRHQAVAGSEIYVAATVEVPGANGQRFYAMMLAGEPQLGPPDYLDAEGSIVQPSAGDTCLPTEAVLSPEQARQRVAGLISESSAQLGVSVGDPCPPPTTDAPPRSSLTLVVDGPKDRPGDDCRVVGWMPVDTIPGIVPGIYGQDGTLLWEMGDPNSSTPPDLYGLLDTPVDGNSD